MVDMLARVDVKRALPDGRRKLVMTRLSPREARAPDCDDVRATAIDDPRVDLRERFGPRRSCA